MCRRRCCETDGRVRPAALAAPDLPALARGELKAILAAVKAALSKTKDRVSLIHLQDMETRVDRILDPRLKP